MRLTPLIGLGVLSIAVAHTGCDQGATDPEPETALTGAWEYVADLAYENGNQCDRTYVITIDHREREIVTDVFTGFAEDGTIACQTSGGEDLVSRDDIPTSAINLGLFVPMEGTLSFDISTSLHHFGRLENEEISGRVRHDDVFGWGEGEGTFEMTRTSSTVD